ncbi:hypothetical protein CHS0354_040632, partial [Potamilus streckersoni]
HGVIFPHNISKVIRINGTTFIDITNCHDDITQWDRQHGEDCKPTFDQAILFTR